MNYICSWLCADEKGEESLFPQTGKKSSSQAHQDIYWRCLLVFYITSKRFNQCEQHVLFTNVKQLPVVDGHDVEEILKTLSVRIVYTDFKYKTPKGYYGSFQNQFYEFSILEYIAKHSVRDDDQFLVLDSDCIFIKPVADLFREAERTGFISFEDRVKPDYVINGLSRSDLKLLYEELLGTEVQEMPSYHLGEFLLCSVTNIKKIFSDFTTLWPELLSRHRQGKPKFNEEAHTLSYLYFKNGFRASSKDHFMKRIWTNPLFYRNVEASDVELSIWHLPSEKTFGLYRLYDQLVNKSVNYGFDIPDNTFVEMVQRMLGIPRLPVSMKWKYYTLSYYRAIRKRMPKLNLAPFIRA